jgi:hypothetical protein
LTTVKLLPLTDIAQVASRPRQSWQLTNETKLCWAFSNCANTRGERSCRGGFCNSQIYLVDDSEAIALD